MPHPVTHFEIVGKDGKKLQSFYANLFGWKVNADNPMNYGIVDTQSGGIGGGIAEMPGPGYGRVTFYVETDDVQATLDTAVANGGKVIMPPMQIPGEGMMAQFADPEGNIVGLFKGM